MVGALGYLMLPGLLLLVCLPNRRRRLLGQSYEHSRADLIAIAKRDRSFGLGYLLLAPSVVLIFAVSALLVYRHSAGSESGEWKEVRSDSGGFVASMPGAPVVESKREKIRFGTVEMHSYSVTTPDRRELYMIVDTHLPEGLENDTGLTFKLYNVGKLDLLEASPGAAVQSEKYTVLGDLTALDLILVPKSGGVIKARIYATKTHYYKVMVQTSQVRIDSADVDQFFGSFHLLGNVSNVGIPIRGKSTPWG